MASVTTRLARALEECNISDAAWLPRGRFLPGGRVVAILAGAAGVAGLRTAEVGLVIATTAIIAALLASAIVATALAMTALRPSAIAVLGMLRGRCVGPSAGAPVGRGDRHPDQPLDIAQEGRFLVIAERDRHAVGAGARGAADGWT